jgi:hypothetical protein
LLFALSLSLACMHAYMYASFDVATFNLLALGEKRLPLRVQEDPDSGFRILTVLYVFES